MNLLVAGVGHEAAVYAVRNWHYSRKMPAGKLVKFGVWEDGRYAGAVLFGRGATPYLGRFLGLDPLEVCELVRIALREHQVPVSQVVAEAIRQLRATNPGLRLVVSFADSAAGHHGAIYQAGNWIYTGESTGPSFRVLGRDVHPKTLHGRYGVGGQSLDWLRANVDPGAELGRTAPKYRYLYPLDKSMRRRLRGLALPYPHAVEGSTASRDVSDVEGQVQPLPTALNADWGDLFAPEKSPRM